MNEDREWQTRPDPTIHPNCRCIPAPVVPGRRSIYLYPSERRIAETRAILDLPMSPADRADLVGSWLELVRP